MPIALAQVVLKFTLLPDFPPLMEKCNKVASSLTRAVDVSPNDTKDI